MCEWSLKARVFVAGRSFKSSLMLVGKARILPRVEDICRIVIG
jgi:hypothetical protein